MINYISISTIKALLDSQIDYYDFEAVDGKSPYRWNSVKIIIYEDDTEKEKAIKMSLFYTVKKLVSTYHEEFETVVENGNIHYLFGTENGYGGYDMWIQYGEDEEEEDEEDEEFFFYDENIKPCDIDIMGECPYHFQNCKNCGK